MAHAYGPTWVIVLHHLWYLMLMRNSVTYLILRRTVGYTNHQRFHHYNRGTYSRSISCRQSIGYKFDQVGSMFNIEVFNACQMPFWPSKKSFFLFCFGGTSQKCALQKFLNLGQLNQLIQLLVNQLPFVTIVVCDFTCQKLQLTLFF